MFKINSLLIAHRDATNTPAATARQEEELQSRRNILLKLVAITSALWLPLAISTSFSANAAAATGSKKATQASVRYQSKPKDKQKCGNCSHFVAASNSCKLVEGKISAEGWCSMWSKS